MMIIFYYFFSTFVSLFFDNPILGVGGSTFISINMHLFFQFPILECASSYVGVLFAYTIKDEDFDKQLSLNLLNIGLSVAILQCIPSSMLELRISVLFFVMWAFIIVTKFRKNKT